MVGADSGRVACRCLTSWVPLWRLKSSYFCRSPVPQWRLKSSFVKYLPIAPLARVGSLIHLCLSQSRGWGIRGGSVSSVTWSLHWSHDHTITWYTFSLLDILICINSWLPSTMASWTFNFWQNIPRIVCNTYFWLSWIHWFHWYGQNEDGCSRGHLEFLTFDRIALESCVISNFRLIWIFEGYILERRWIPGVSHIDV